MNDINKCLYNLSILDDFSTKMNITIDKSFYKTNNIKTLEILENETNHFANDAITMMNSYNISDQKIQDMSRRCNILYREIYSKLKSIAHIYSV